MCGKILESLLHAMHEESSDAISEYSPILFDLLIHSFIHCTFAWVNTILLNPLNIPSKLNVHYFQFCPLPIYPPTYSFPKKTCHLISFVLKYPFFLIHPSCEHLPTSPSILIYKSCGKSSLTSLGWRWFSTSGLPNNPAITPMKVFTIPYLNSWLPVFYSKLWFPGGQRLMPHSWL